MNVLLLGSGGREHAMFWKLRQSSRLNRLFVFPGNGGFPDESIAHGLDLKNFQTIRTFVSREKIDLIVVGPEQPLVDGIVDVLSNDCAVFGPTKNCARLEGSKDF